MNDKQTTNKTMKIALAQQNYTIGDFEGNFKKITHAIETAIRQNADLILFSEMAVCGYPSKNFINYQYFIAQCQNTLQQIVALANDKIAVVVGAPSENIIANKKKLCNSAFFIENGRVKYTVHKTTLSTHSVLDEYSYFTSGNDLSRIEFKGKKIAITIGEDIFQKNPSYNMELGSRTGLDFILNLSASPFDYGQAKKRLETAAADAKTYKIPVFCCNSVGAQTELIFDGGSFVVNAHGELIDEMPYFEECISVYDTAAMTADGTKKQEKNPTQLIHDALILGIKDFFNKSGFRRAILGLSGGVDSALALYFAVQALGKENVLSVLMPSKFSTQHSVDDSLKLLENLGSPPHKIIPIKETFEVMEAVLQPHFDGKPFDTAEENMQARIRAIYLMALSNKYGYVLLNTSNKSEAAVGYGTLYGDMCGGLAVLADVYKTQVYALCRWINRNGEIISANIIEKAPSAELRPDQKDADSLPEYEVLDKILYEYIENSRSLNEIKTATGYDEALITHILKLVNKAEFKRRQAPPALRVSSKAFGSGFKLPVVNGVEY
jgi:NAD+ synthase (glutamine-hydrolysing)